MQRITSALMPSTSRSNNILAACWVLSHDKVERLPVPSAGGIRIIRRFPFMNYLFRPLFANKRNATKSSDSLPTIVATRTNAIGPNSVGKCFSFDDDEPPVLFGCWWEFSQTLGCTCATIRIGWPGLLLLSVTPRCSSLPGDAHKTANTNGNGISFPQKWCIVSYGIGGEDMSPQRHLVNRFNPTGSIWS